MKNIKTGLNRLVNSMAFVVMIGILLLVKTIFFYQKTIAITENLEMITLLGTFSFLIVLVCFICVLPNRARGWMSIVLNFFISLLLFGDHIYYIFSNNVLSVAQITNLQYGEEIRKTLPMVLEVKQVVYFSDIFILAILLATHVIKIEKKDKKSNQQKLGKLVIGMMGIIIFCLISVEFVQRGEQKSYNKDLQIREATIWGYHIYDIRNALNLKKQTKYKNTAEMKKDYEMLKQKYEEKYDEVDPSLAGIVQKQNVIILQLESVQEFVLHRQINEKEITPNLNRFLEENIEFTDMHMQSYSTTADSEHSTITSLYPMENGMSFSQYYTNTYDDIFNLFHEANYNTSYMHGNYPYFWNRGNVYSKMKVDHLVFKEQFEDLSENINGDLSDELFYRQAVQKLKEYQKPFFSYLVAASSHTPFTLEGLQDRNKVTIDVGKYKNTYFGNYLEAMNYADYAFGVFLEELKKEDLYDRTTILVFGDHNGLNMYNEEMLDFLQQTNSNLKDIDIKLNYTRVACGMKMPGMRNTKITKPINKLDIKPTLAYLCDLEDGISLGTNLFGKKDFICLNNERIITDQYYYDESWYSRQTGEEISLDQLKTSISNDLMEKMIAMKTEIELSTSISIHNLLK